MSPPKMQLSNNCRNKVNGIIQKLVKVKKPKLKRSFVYGNYNRYYGYRNTGGLSDSRIEAFQTRKELFVNKDVLDIGCNIGHVTYLVARDLFAKTILGIDIDNSLIQIARKNISFYDQVPSPVVTNLMEQFGLKPNKRESTFKFPDNVTFLHSNYVLYDDKLFDLEIPKYDVILCLSITKWIQLNWGDEGLIRTFKRIFLQLRSNGVLVLEAQPLESYKKKKLQAALRFNVKTLKLLPHMFDEYLLKEIGFKSCELLTVPDHTSKGFRRPIKLFFKE